MFIHKIKISAVLCIALFALLVVGTPEILFAQDAAGNVVDGQVESFEENIALNTDTSLPALIARILNIFFGLLGVILVCVILWAGYLLMTANGDDQKFALGKTTIRNAIVGLVVIMVSWTAATFIINQFRGATVGFNNGFVAERPEFINFNGSGALGRIVEDHYPSRDQENVKRNTSIVVTFADAIDPSSVLTNTNETCWTEDGESAQGDACARNGNGDILDPYYGDCVTVNGSVLCDQLQTNAVQIFASAVGNEDAGPLIEGTALTSYEGANRNAHTFVFRPTTLLGSTEEAVWYTVQLTSNILQNSGESVFANARSDRYAWTFQTGIDLDIDPPHVAQVYPSGNGIIPRNSIIQITFDDAMDPTMLQGETGLGSDFIHLVFEDPTIEGSWRLTNGYRTLEFISNQTCGQNSCGDAMYCLPLAGCVEGDVDCQVGYEVLLRTAQLTGSESIPFEAIPFTGVMDLAGNALDGRTAGGEGLYTHNGLAEGKPAVGLQENGDVRVHEIGEQERQADNFWWNFTVQNVIDRTPPYLRSLTPDIDTMSVPASLLPEMLFSETMWFGSLRDGIAIEEYPANVEGLDDLGYVVRAESDEETGQTRVWIEHRDFGPNDLDLYYFPSIASGIKDAQQNCFYPGLGPVEQGQDCVVDAQGNAVGCTPVVGAAALGDTSCVVANPENEAFLAKDTIEACLNALKAPDVSPVTDRAL